MAWSKTDQDKEILLLAPTSYFRIWCTFRRNRKTVLITPLEAFCCCARFIPIVVDFSKLPSIILTSINFKIIAVFTLVET